MDGVIRKIVVGENPKDAMVYMVDSRAGKGRISSIIEDDHYLHKYGIDRFKVYIETDEGNELWKVVTNRNITQEFDLNF